jgi:uncharacterized protein YndB with AHSA1/START domain
MPTETRTYEVEVRATPERLWQSLTDPELTQQYYFGTRVESDWAPGSPVRYRNAQGGVDVDGEVVEAERGRRLVTTFRPAWEPAVEGTPPSTVTWEITPQDQATRLRVTHDGIDPAAVEMYDGSWQGALQALRQVLQAGEPVPA